MFETLALIVAVLTGMSVPDSGASTHPTGGSSACNECVVH
jgi:hypothetical protein